VFPKRSELIYIVEDEPGVAQFIRQTLEKYGFVSECFASGRTFLQQLKGQTPALCILDLGLPDVDGMEIVHHIRDNHGFGVLILSGRSDIHDRVMGLEFGADDYMIKPFEPRELIARVRSILRRYHAVGPQHSPDIRYAEFAGWRFEPSNNRLTSPDGKVQTLSVAEAELLGMLLAAPNQIHSREQLLSGRNLDALDRSVDLRISRLRKHLEENNQHARLIKTVYGAGYLLGCQVEWH